MKVIAQKEHSPQISFFGFQGRMKFTVATFYLFADLPDYEKKQPLIKEFCEDQSVFGTIILAPEGINGTISGERKNIDAAEYKYVVLGLVFIKYISESFSELYN